VVNFFISAPVYPGEHFRIRSHWLRDGWAILVVRFGLVTLEQLPKPHSSPNKAGTVPETRWFPFTVGWYLRFTRSIEWWQIGLRW